MRCRWVPGGGSAFWPYSYITATAKKNVTGYILRPILFVAPPQQKCNWLHFEANSVCCVPATKNVTGYIFEASSVCGLHTTEQSLLVFLEQCYSLTGPFRRACLPSSSGAIVPEHDKDRDWVNKRKKDGSSRRSCPGPLSVYMLT